jgi:hypothetical protein
MLATSITTALPSAFLPVSPMPFEKTPMIPRAAVIDSEIMMKTSRDFRVGIFMDNRPFLPEFRYNHRRDRGAIAPE